MSGLAAFEPRSARAGLPLFIEDTTASEDVWTRAAPLLALVFIGELLGRDPARLAGHVTRDGSPADMAGDPDLVTFR